MYVCYIACRIDNFCINFNEGLRQPYTIPIQAKQLSLTLTQAINPTTSPPAPQPAYLFSIYFVINDYEMSIVGARTPDTNRLRCL